MSDKTPRYANAAVAFTIALILLMFSWLTVGVEFPAFEFTSDTLRRQLIPEEPFDNIATLTTRFMWEHRALDLTGQSFVIVAAVIACLALMKMEEGGH